MKYQILILLMLSTNVIVKAQTTNFITPIQTLDSAGGEGSGEGGSISISVGQLSYTTISDPQLEIYQGVQIPAFNDAGTIAPAEKPLKIDIQAYPNPTTDYFVLNVQNYENEDLTYEFYNLQGKLIETKPINSSKTTINSSNLEAAVYLLRISYKNIPIKTLKIIKR